VPTELLNNGKRMKLLFKRDSKEINEEKIEKLKKKIVTSAQNISRKKSELARLEVKDAKLKVSLEKLIKFNE